jgi:hypothetical protein
MNHRFKIFFITAWAMLSSLSGTHQQSVRAEVGDPTLQTNHPIYPGEGAFQEIEDCVRFATRGKTMAQDQAIALYQWMLTHQYHLMSPQECLFPGEPVDTANSRVDRTVYDANRARFSYGYGLCGTVHAWNEPYWKALGMPARRRAFPGHTNSEVFYDGSWHAFDTDMAGLLFRKDGVVAGYEDIIADPGLIMSVQPPLPHYPFAWPGDFEAMRIGWKEIAKGGDWFKLYNGGYAAHPGIVHLRAGETWTRWFDRDHYGGPSERRFWHNGKGGPERHWTFVNMGEPFHDGERANARGYASYCNGDFVYTPALHNDSFLEGVTQASENLRAQSKSPRLHSSDAKPASVVFQHHSPYVICGKPIDGANPMTGKATDGFVINATLVGDVQCRISTDGGQTWTDVDFEPAEGSAGNGSSERLGVSTSRQTRIDATDLVKGHYGWLVALSWDGQAGVDAITFQTTTQVSQSIYPRLKPGGSDVTFRVASRGVTAFSPNFSLPESDCEKFEMVSMRSGNVIYKGASGQSLNAYETTNNKPGQVVFRLDQSVQPIRQVRAALRYAIRSPTPEGADYSLEVSTDLGKSWRRFAQAEIASDNEFSSGWLAGQTDVDPSPGKPILVRANLYAGGYRTGLLQADLYGIYQTRTPQQATLTYGWKEAGELKTWTQVVSGSSEGQRFQIPTAEKIEDAFARIAVPQP